MRSGLARERVAARSAPGEIGVVELPLDVLELLLDVGLVGDEEQSPVAAIVLSAPVTRLDADSADRVAARLRDDAARLTELIAPRPGL